LNAADASTRGRVERVIAAGRRIQDPKDPLGEEARARLSGTTGLSREGIDLALCRHLETQPTDAEIDALLARTGRAARCHVVLSANVCTAPLRAFALAVATSPRVHVRPSRRDPVVAELLARFLQEDELFRHTLEGTIELVDAITPAAGEELHVYGSDASIAAITRGLPPGVVVRGHGTGFGIAVVGFDVSLEGAGEAVASDVVPFDQRGCLSPRLVLVEGLSERAEALARELDESLERAAKRVPRGPLDAATAAEIALYGASMEAVGSFLARPSHAIGVDPFPRAFVLPPAARVVHVVAAQAEDVPRLLDPWVEFLTTVGAHPQHDGPLTRAVHARAPYARRSVLGSMQRPPLDGPVDLRPSRAPEPRAGIPF
jgi:hypothetical protein